MAGTGGLEMINIDNMEGTETVDSDINTISDELEYILKANDLYSKSLYDILSENKIDPGTIRNDVKQNEIDELCTVFNENEGDNINNTTKPGPVPSIPPHSGGTTYETP